MDFTFIFLGFRKYQKENMSTKELNFIPFKANVTTVYEPVH